MEWTREHEEGYQDAEAGEPLFRDACERYREGWARFHSDMGNDLAGMEEYLRPPHTSLTRGTNTRQDGDGQAVAEAV